MKSIAKNSVYNIIYMTGNILFQLVTSMHVSRILMAEGIGRVAYAQNIASYFVILASLGTPVYGIRQIANNWDDAQKKNRTFTQLFIINAAATLVSTAAYFVFVSIVLGGRGETALFICAGLQLLFNFFNIDWLYRGEEDYKYITLRSLAIKAVSITAVFLFVKKKEDYIVYALISSLALCGNYVFNMVHAFRYVRFDFSEFEWRAHMKPLLILFFGIFLSTGYSMVDVTMLGSMGTEQAIGYYNNAHKAANIIVTMCTAISAVFLPRLSYYYQQNRKEMEALIDKGCQVLAFVTFPIAMGIYILAPDILELLYGPEFLPAAATLRILAVLIVILSFGNLLCYQLIMATGNEKKRLPAAVMATIANIILNAIMIPRWQENGAAVASIISELIVNGYQILHVRKVVRIRISQKAMLQGIGTSAAMGAVVWLAARWILDMRLRCALCPMIGCSVYFFLNLLLKNDTFLYGVDILKKGLKRCRA